MTDEALFELLEEARQACGKNAVALAAFLGARLPNEPPGLKVSLRRRVADLIAQFTGKRVDLPLQEAFERCEDCPRPDTCREAARCMCSQIKKFEAPDEFVKQSGQVEEKLNSSNADLPEGCEPCQVCGKPIRVGEWGCITRVVAHGPSVQTTAFAAYFDVGLGKEVTGLGDRHVAMRPEGTQIVRDKDGKVVAEASGRGRLTYRDLPSKGELSARADRLHEQRRKADRRG